MPSGWEGSVPLLAQAAYIRELESTPDILDGHCVLLAGGAAGWPFSKESSFVQAHGVPGPKDIDLFPYGEDATDAKIARLRGVLVDREINRHAIRREVLQQGVYTLSYKLDGEIIEEWQIILRAHRSIAGILNSFDIGPSAVGYDPRTRTTWFTLAGAIAYLFGVILVDPVMRSTSYEERLWRYFSRGFALLLPHFRGFSSGVGSYNLPYLTLRVTHVVGMTAIGRAEECLRKSCVDYETTDQNTVQCPVFDIADAAMRVNLANLLWSKPAFMATGDDAGASLSVLDIAFAIAPVGYQSSSDDSSDDESSANTSSAARPPEGFGSLLARCSHLDFKADVLTRPALERYLNKAVDNFGGIGYNASTWFQQSLLRKVLLMTESEHNALWESLQTKIKQYGTRFTYRMASHLRPYMPRVLAAYDTKETHQIDAWIREDPGRQWTASLNPLVSDPRDYYGEYCLEPGQRPRPYTYASESCGICHGAVLRGGPNTTTTHCGHTYHFAPVEECRGLMSCEVYDKCPTCKTPLNSPICARDERRVVQV